MQLPLSLCALQNKKFDALEENKKYTDKNSADYSGDRVPNSESVEMAPLKGPPGQAKEAVV